MICDFAQYYHILNWRALPLRLAATLAAGLPEESRCKTQRDGLAQSTQLQAAATDALHRIEWRLCGCPGGYPPQSILASLTESELGAESDVQSFSSGSDFEAACQLAKGGG